MEFTPDERNSSFGKLKKNNTFDLGWSIQNSIFFMSSIPVPNTNTAILTSTHTKKNFSCDNCDGRKLMEKSSTVWRQKKPPKVF
jgi:hypothetical protein